MQNKLGWSCHLHNLFHWSYIQTTLIIQAFKALISRYGVRNNKRWVTLTVSTLYSLLKNWKMYHCLAGSSECTLCCLDLSLQPRVTKLSRLLPKKSFPEYKLHPNSSFSKSCSILLQVVFSFSISLQVVLSFSFEVDFCSLHTNAFSSCKDERAW